MPPGKYFNFGLRDNLERLLEAVNCKGPNISIFVHFYGCPISKSSGGQLWSILRLIRDVKPREKVPFVIGLYYGLRSPLDSNLYIADLVDELD